MPAENESIGRMPPHSIDANKMIKEYKLKEKRQAE